MSHRMEPTESNAYHSTDHSEEIALLRARVKDIQDRHLPGECPESERREAAMLMCAAALLEVHDDTGISLDEWVGPRELVEEALMLVGKEPEDFLENGV